MHDDGRLCTTEMSVLGSCRTRKLAINDSMGNLLTCLPCSISSCEACDWWRTGELLAKAAPCRPFRAKGRDRQLRRARWLERC